MASRAPVGKPAPRSVPGPEKGVRKQKKPAGGLAADEGGHPHKPSARHRFLQLYLAVIVLRPLERRSTSTGSSTQR
jgi:hypothetical protein